jgi:hypothetical protein
LHLLDDVKKTIELAEYAFGSRGIKLQTRELCQALNIVGCQGHVRKIKNGLDRDG